jgi:hypothetical protein
MNWHRLMRLRLQIGQHQKPSGATKHKRVSRLSSPPRQRSRRKHLNKSSRKPPTSVDRLDVGPLFRAYGWDTKPEAPAHELLSLLCSQPEAGCVTIVSDSVGFSLGDDFLAPLDLVDLVRKSGLQETLLRVSPTASEVIRILGEPEARVIRETARYPFGWDTYEYWSYAGGTIEVIFTKLKNGEVQRVVGNRFNPEHADRLYIGDGRDTASDESPASKKKKKTVRKAALTYADGVLYFIPVLKGVRVPGNQRLCLCILVSRSKHKLTKSIVDSARDGIMRYSAVAETTISESGVRAGTLFTVYDKDGTLLRDGKSVDIDIGPIPAGATVSIGIGTFDPDDPNYRFLRFVTPISTLGKQRDPGTSP